MKAPHRLFLVLFSLGAALCADAALAARQHAAPTQTRYARWVADHQRYPVGSPDFYRQFSTDRDAVDLADASLQASGNEGENSRGMTARSGGMWTGPAADAGMTRFLRADTQYAAPAPRPAGAPANLVLPLAALGLMLFVARRRALLQ